MRRNKHKKGQALFKVFRLQPTITDHDLEHKKRQIFRHLKAGRSVRVEFRLLGWKKTSARLNYQAAATVTELTKEAMLSGLPVKTDALDTTGYHSLKLIV